MLRAPPSDGSLRFFLRALRFCVAVSCAGTFEGLPAGRFSLHEVRSSSWFTRKLIGPTPGFSSSVTLCNIDVFPFSCDHTKDRRLARAALFFANNGSQDRFRKLDDQIFQQPVLLLENFEGCPHSYFVVQAWRPWSRCCAFGQSHHAFPSLGRPACRFHGDIRPDVAVR